MTELRPLSLIATALLALLSSCVSTQDFMASQQLTATRLDKLEQELAAIDTKTQQREQRIAEELGDLKHKLVAGLGAISTQLERPVPSQLNQTQPPPPPKPASSQEDVLEINNKFIVGESEWIYLHELGEHLPARVDSGAATSSISAINIQRYERDGENWVRFDISHDDQTLAENLEAPIVRRVKIRQANSEETQRRYVVEFAVSLGNRLQQRAEFTLANRSEMNYPVLLGREFLQDLTLIDVGKEYLHPKFQLTGQ